MVMHAGQYRTRLIMEENTSDPTVTAADQAADGYVAPQWTEVARPWCRVQQMGGRELIEYGAELDDQPVIIECRYDKRFAAVNPTGWRLTSLDATVAYDILSGVNPMLRNERWQFMCRAGSMVPT